jgi:hypothetical protein
MTGVEETVAASKASWKTTSIRLEEELVWLTTLMSAVLPSTPGVALISPACVYRMDAAKGLILRFDLESTPYAIAFGLFKSMGRTVGEGDVRARCPSIGSM